MIIGEVVEQSRYAWGMLAMTPAFEDPPLRMAKEKERALLGKTPQPGMRPWQRRNLTAVVGDQQIDEGFGRQYVTDIYPRAKRGMLAAKSGRSNPRRQQPSQRME